MELARREVNKTVAEPEEGMIYEGVVTGIKEFGVVDFEPWELGHWFREFKEFIPGCRYANCTHQHEPGCAVREAAEAGKIHEERYSNYLGILNNISA